MMKLLAAIFGIVKEALVAYNSNISQRKRAERKVEDEAKERESRSREIRRAVREKDKDRIAKMLSAFVAVSMLSFLGCFTEFKSIQYVPCDRVVEPMTNSVGVVGWFVSDTIFEELLIDRLRVQELDKEQKVDKLMNGGN